MKEYRQLIIDCVGTIPIHFFEEGNSYSLSCIMAMLPVSLRFPLQNIHIQQEDLVRRETESHITLACGLHTNDPSVLRKVILNHAPLHATLGSFNFFPPSETNPLDVLIVEVFSPDMKKFNMTLRNFPHTNGFNYHPHVTIAYMQPGTAEKYIHGYNPLRGLKLSFDSLTFSNHEKHKTVLSLKG